MDHPKKGGICVKTVDEHFERCFAILLQARLEAEGQRAKGLRIVRQQREKDGPKDKEKASA